MEPRTVDASSITRADAEYVGFGQFTEWEAAQLDGDLWQRYYDRLESRRAVASPDAISRAISVAVREAALDSNAIEGLYEVTRGFTYSVALEAAAWQSELQERGDQARPLFEAQLAAYEVVLDAATKQSPITEVLIRTIHERLTEPQDSYRVLTPSGWQDQSLPKGAYKTQANHPWRDDGTLAKAYAPVLDTPAEMHRLAEELASSGFEAAHPVLQAAYAHHALVAIHPFADGNGRVARALASVYLYRAARIPLVIYADQQAGYITALEAADAGDKQPFISFILDRGISTLARAADLLRVGALPPTESLVSRIRGLTTSVAGLTYQELDTIAARITVAVRDEIQRQLPELQLPATIRSELSNFSSVPVPEDLPGYRAPINPAVAQYGFTFTAIQPARGNQAEEFDIWVATDRDAHATFVVRRRNTGEDLEIPITSIHPDSTADFQYRLRLMIETSINESLSQVGDLIESSLRSQGYLG